MLIVIGVVSGGLLGVLLSALWGLRKAKGGGAELLMVALMLLPIAFFYGADLIGWPTPGSIAVSTGAVTKTADRWFLAGTQLVTAAVVVAVLVKTGVTRRLERWSRKPE